MARRDRALYDELVSVVYTKDRELTPETELLMAEAHVVGVALLVSSRIEIESDRLSERELRAFIKNRAPGYDAVQEWIVVAPYSGPLRFQ